MKIVDLTKDITKDTSFIKLTMEHISMLKDKISFPDPEKYDYNWSNPKLRVVQMFNEGILKGKVLLDEDSLVQGYVLFAFSSNPLTNDLRLYVMALIVAQNYKNSYSAGRLIQSVIDYAKDHGCKQIEWSINFDAPGEELFYKHPDKFIPMHQVFLQNLEE